MDFVGTVNLRLILFEIIGLNVSLRIIFDQIRVSICLEC